MKHYATMLVTFLMSTCVAVSDTITVYPDTHDGISPAQQLVNAVANAKAGDTISIKEGSYTFNDEYTEVFNGATNLLLVKVANLTIEGENSSSRTNWTDHSEPVVIDANNKGRIFCFSKNLGGITVRNLTLTGASTAGGINSLNKSGGGGFNLGEIDDVVFSNCVFRQNFRCACGAAYKATMRDCLVTNCTDSAYQNDLLHAVGESKIYDCDFVGNTCGCTANCYAYNSRFVCNSRPSGGFNTNPYVVSNCYFESNSGSYVFDCSDGAAFYDCVFTNNTMVNTVLHCPSLVAGCKFWRNTSTSGSALGCGIDFSSTRALARNAQVSKCDFRNNRNTGANGLGAAICLRNSDVVNCTVMVTNCHFEGNSAAKGGGAIYNDDSAKPVEWDKFVVYDSTFVTNEANNAAGVYGVRCVNCTFDRNVRLQTSDSYRAGDAGKSMLERCDMTGGDLANCVVDRCTIHDVTTNAAGKLGYIFRDWCRVTNSIIMSCKGGTMYSVGKNGAMDAEFVNCTFATNDIYTYNFGNDVVTTNYVKFKSCLFGRNRYGSNLGDFAQGPNSGGAYMWENRFQFEDTYYTAFTANSSRLTEELFEAKVGEGGLHLCADPKFVGESASAMARYPEEPHWALSLRSPLLGKGGVVDWPEDATDRRGRPRVRDGKVDVGCYQCWLSPIGLILNFR